MINKKRIHIDLKQLDMVCVLLTAKYQKTKRTGIKGRIYPGVWLLSVIKSNYHILKNSYFLRLFENLLTLAPF